MRAFPWNLHCKGQLSLLFLLKIDADIAVLILDLHNIVSDTLLVYQNSKRFLFSGSKMEGNKCFLHFSSGVVPC